MTAAPPRYLLVGKLISSFRYTWMVLVLSLPITASCVVLGGATWTSVVLSYVLISLFALLCAAVGLSVSTYAKKPTGAIAWAFAGIGVYTFGSSILAALTSATSAMSLVRGGHNAPFTLLLSPGAVVVAEALDTTTSIGAFEVPNILLAGGTILLVVRYLLHVGGLAIAHRSARNIAMFRIDSLITFILVSGGMGALVGPAYSGAAFRAFGGGSAPSAPTGTTWGWVLVVVLMVVVPTISAYGFEGFKLARPDRAFSLRQTLSGRPSGALPFILLLVVASAAAYAIGFRLVGASVGLQFVGTVGFILAYGIAIWALTRSSASTLIGAKQATTVGIATTLLFVFGLLAFFVTTTIGSWYRTGEQWWMLYPMRPILGDRLDVTNLTHGGFFLVVALLLTIRGENRLARNLSNPPKMSAQPPVNHVPV